MALSPESLKILESVKKTGNPCRFVVVKKAGDVAALAAFRKGSEQTHITSAKQEAGGGGEACMGVIDGQGVNLRFTLLNTDYKAPPVKDSKLKDFLKGCDKAFKDTKAYFEVVKALPDVAEDDGQQQGQTQQPQTGGTQQGGNQPQSQQDSPKKYRTRDEWTAVVSAVQKENDPTSKTQLLSKAALECKAEKDLVKLHLQTEPNSDLAQAQHVILTEVSDALKKLNPLHQPLQPKPTQTQQPTLPPVPKTPVTIRCEKKWDEAKKFAEEGKKGSSKANALKSDPFPDTDLDQLSETVKHAAENTAVGIAKDKTLIAVVDGVAEAENLMKQGLLLEAQAKLSEIKSLFDSGKAAEEKHRDKAVLGATKHLHNQRLTEYTKLERVIAGGLTRVNDALSDLQNTGNNLAKSVAQMLKDHQTTPDVLNPRLVDNLEEFLKSPGLSKDVVGVYQGLVTKARAAIDAEYKKKMSEAKSEQQKANILLELGSCPGPQDRKDTEKGKSDSFFLKGPDGKLQYVMKPMQGESLTSSDWEPGGGPVREILSSKLNDIIKGQTGGFDCRGLKTELVQLDDPNLGRGNLSQESKRIGSLQTAAPGQGVTAGGLYEELEDRSPQGIKKFKEQFNEDDCQAIALRHFLTFDQDAHCGNLMIDKQGDGPGQTRLIPIDAGQSLPSPEAAKRNAPALRIGGTPKPDGLNDKELLILQLPAATKPFSGEALKAIQSLDPDKIAKEMKEANDKLVQHEPSMAGKVDPGAFDLVRKSAKFLKMAAAAGLTLYEISMVYGEGFGPVIEATDDKAENAALQAALNTALALKAKQGGIEGIEVELLKKGFTGGKTGEVNELRLDQKQRILDNGWDKAEWDRRYELDLRNTELKDIAKYFHQTAPESAAFPALLKNGFQGKDKDFLKLLENHRRKGGDAVIAKSLAGNDATLAYELRQPVAKKIGSISGGFNLWELLNYLNEIGGTQRLLAGIDRSFLGQPLKDQLDAYDVAEKKRKAEAVYDEAGGDKLLSKLAEAWLPYYAKVDGEYEQALANWNKNQTGEKPDDPLSTKQRNLPKTNAEIDTLLASNITNKNERLTSLKAWDKKNKKA